MADRDVIQTVLKSIYQEFELVTGTKWVSYDPDKWKTTKRDPTISLEDELQLFRKIMALMKYKLDEDIRKCVSFNLSMLLVQDHGLKKLIMAVFDLDESSQKVTTLDQRFVAVSNVICFMPFTCVPFSSYVEHLAPQVHCLYLNRIVNEQKLSYFRKIATHIINGLISRQKKLASELVIGPLIESFTKQTKQKRMLSIDDCIEVFYGLTVTNFDLKYLLPAFHNLFYVRVLLDSTLSAKKSKVSTMLQEFMKGIDYAIYLLDDCLFNHLDCYQSYDKVIDDKDGSCHVIFKADNNIPDEMDIKVIDNVTTVAIDLVESSLKNESKVDLCIHLLDRLTVIHAMKQSQGLLLCSFLSTLQDRIQELFVQHPTKFIRFVVTTLNRHSVHQDVHKRVDTDENFDFKEGNFLQSLQNDSTSVAIQILKIIISEKDKLDHDAVVALKECIDALGKVIEIVENERKELHGETLDISSLNRLKQEISDLDPDHVLCQQDGEKRESLEQAFKDLNDPLMPTRAHSLVTIKHLILAKDKKIMENKDRVLELLKSSIGDEESYIYLLAINTLAALAVTHTSSVLPVLTSLYLNEHRTIQERINVGEVILQLIKNIGDFAAHYSRPLLDCFYSGVMDTEPMIRTSSLSNLGQVCSILKYSLKPHINQIMNGIKCLIQTESDIQVKRAAIMFLHLLLDNIDSDCIEVISDQLPDIYRLVKNVYNNSLDDVMQLHAQLAFEQLDRIGKQLLSPREDGTLTRKKNLIQVLD